MNQQRARRLFDFRFLFTLILLSVGLSGCGPSHSAQNAPLVSELPPAINLASGWELQDAAKIPEGGPAISSTAYQPDHWYRATVPGTVLTTLVNDGVYPDPLYGENDRPDRIPDSLCRTSYWYRTTFEVQAAFAGRHIRLNFHGINYVAEVFVNGHDIGKIEGAFARGQFDITPFAASGQPNALAVLITPPPHPGVPHEHTVAAGTGPNGGILSEDGPTFLCTLGWDWIPAIRDRDIGIWQKVTLSASGSVELLDPMIDSDLSLPSRATADLTLTTTLRNLSGTTQTGTLHGSFGNVSFDYPVTLGGGETRQIHLTPRQVPQLRVNHPRLWWPNGYGPANLYAMHLRFTISGETSDFKTFNFGIRKITYSLPGSDNLAISVNGVPVMCKGGDWGMDEAMKRIDRKRLEAQIRMHQEANFNMIRNWVGQSTSEDFYDLCDRCGIMVWDEFFQPNKSDGPNVLNVPMYLANVREKILRFRSHPCIAIWCGRNESDPAPEAVDAGIQEIAAELDPGRLYHRNSADGRGVRSGGPYRWREPREFYTFGEAFKTEIGSVSIPTIEAIHAMMPEKDWETVNDDWAEHDLCRGAQEASWGRSLLYPEILGRRYGQIANLPDFVRKAQLANYEAFRAMYEARFAKLFNPCTGVLTWMSNPAQNSFVWQIYSHDLEANASLFAARKACEPVHIEMTQSDFHVVIVNNTPKSLRGIRRRLRIFNLDSQLQCDQTSKVSANACAATDLGPIDWPADLSPVHFIRLDLLDSGDRTISSNFYWRALPAHPDSFAALNQLPLVKLTASEFREDSNGQTNLHITLGNPTHSIALMAHLQLRRGKSGQRVLPAFYSDNYITLVPGETRSIVIQAATDDLAGEEPMVALDGWNVAIDPSSSPAIAENTEALVSSVPSGHWTVEHPPAMHFTFFPPSTQPAAPPKRANPSAMRSPTGIFDDDADIGDVRHPGKLDFNAEDETYTITGNGSNMWFASDAFHFAWKTLSGDCALSADIAFHGQGKNPHRKACLLVRQSLDADSAYADAALHGSGLTSLQFRETTAATTHEVQSAFTSPTHLRIEKRGDRVYMFVGNGDGPPAFSGASIAVKLEDPYYVGLGVCSHDSDVSETAVFSNVHLENFVPSTTQPAPTTRPVLHSTLETISIASTDRKVVYTAAHFEAPNWTPDGQSLLFNQDGRIFSIPVAGGTPRQIDTGSCIHCNNDHGISPDGSMLAISDHSLEPHQSIIFTLPITGGTPRRITQNHPSYWHGWSPDGKTLAFCGQRNGKFGIFTISAEGGEETRLTTADGLDNGPDYSPDGKYIYFNSDRSGLMQIWRMATDGSNPEQITTDDANNWFAHPSPDGKWIAFLTYDKSVNGHPANKDVTLRLMSLADRKIKTLAKLFGGQGTINVPSWSPDSQRLAFVSYHILVE
jgi:beta-mannosidase